MQNLRAFYEYMANCYRVPRMEAEKGPGAYSYFEITHMVIVQSKSCLSLCMALFLFFGDTQVSNQAKEFLEFVYEEPLLDIQQLNPCLYQHCEPLASVLILRQRLQSLRAYLFSCRAAIAEDLRRR